MTHHTDTERALFEAVASDDGKWPKAIERDAKGNYLLLTTANGWMWWQAARRAPSMPDQSIIEAVDGWFARNTALGGCSDKDVAELAAIFAAAPQPPEADMGIPISQTNQQVEAPVQLPEPVAAESRFTTFAGNRWRWCTVEHARAFGADKGYEVRYLYTEQQVRQLLAAHGKR